MQQEKRTIDDAANRLIEFVNIVLDDQDETDVDENAKLKLKNEVTILRQVIPKVIKNDPQFYLTRFKVINTSAAKYFEREELSYVVTRKFIEELDEVIQLID